MVHPWDYCPKCGKRGHLVIEPETVCRLYRPRQRRLTIVMYTYHRLRFRFGHYLGKNQQVWHYLCRYPISHRVLDSRDWHAPLNMIRHWLSGIWESSNKVTQTNFNADAWLTVWNDKKINQKIEHALSKLRYDATVAEFNEYARKRLAS